MKTIGGLDTKNLFSLTLALVWLILFALLLRRDVFVPSADPSETKMIAEAAQEEYQGVYFQGQRIGYVRNRFTPEADQTLTIAQDGLLRLNILGATHAIELKLQAHLTAQNRLDTFSFSLHSPFYHMEAKGKSRGKQIDLSLATGNSTIKDTIRLSEPPILSTSRRPFLLQQGLKSGDKIKIPWFDPISLTGKDSTIEYRGRSKTLIEGRIYNLHHFIEQFGGTRINVWLNDEGSVVKEESGAGFLFLKEPKFKAMTLNPASKELLSAVAVPIRGKMFAVEGLASASYRLDLPKEAEIDLNQGRQRYQGGVLTLRREQLPGEQDAGRPSCPGQEQALAASPYVQADHQEIVALAREITQETASPLARIRLLSGWVHANLEKRPVIGIPDALSTLKSRRGDCNEHAALLAALARAAGIPARIVAGVVLHRGAFYYHAWNEVCLDKEWLSLDSTTKQLPADLSHLQFVQGEMAEQAKLGALLGRLSIEPLSAHSKEDAP